MKYNFDKVIDRTITHSYKHKLSENNDLLSLSVADGDIVGCNEIIDAIKNASSDGIFGYTYTSDEYYYYLKEWYHNKFGFDFDNGDVISICGVVFAIAIAIKTYTKPNDAIIITEPVYHPFRRTIEINDRKVISADLYIKDNKYYIDFTDFERKITDNNVKMFILCSPHNPVGRVWTIDELKQIGNICKRHNVLVFSDEIHSDFAFKPFVHHPFMTVDQTFKDFSIVATAPSKTFNIAGLQASNIIIKNKELRDRFIKTLDELTLNNSINMLALHATLAAYKYGDDWLSQLKEYINDNYEYIKRELKDTHVKLIDREGTYLIWLDFSYYHLNEKLNDYIINECRLVLSDGAMFGKPGTNFMRVNLCTNKTNIKEFIKRIKHGFK